MFIHAQIKENIKLRITSICAGNSSVTGGFPAQMASNTEIVSIWWRRHASNLFVMQFISIICCPCYWAGLIVFHWHLSASRGQVMSRHPTEKCLVADLFWFQTNTVDHSNVNTVHTLNAKLSHSHACRWPNTVETLYSTIYYSKYFIKLNIDKSTLYVALWTHKRHPIPRPFGRAMECLLWVLQQKLIVL